MLWSVISKFRSLLEAGKYSDLTIVCGMKRYAVHRAIICSRSGFFDGACSHTFREAETGIIDLSEDDPEAVEHMIDCNYLQVSLLLVRGWPYIFRRFLPSGLYDQPWSRRHFIHRCQRPWISIYSCFSDIEMFTEEVESGAGRGSFTCYRSGELDITAVPVFRILGPHSRHLAGSSVR